MTIQWEASDADGDNLTYTVLYSDNGGQTWTVLDTFLEQESYTVNATELPGSGEAG
jgi:hypothetical protein